jgi:enoyl-CoA hydratase/carnithine racemase
VLVKGGLVNGAEAHAMGMLDQCVPTADGLDAAAGELAGRIAQGGTLALRATKELLNQLDGSTDLETLRKAAKLSAEVFNSLEAQERMRAKLAK